MNLSDTHAIKSGNFSATSVSAASDGKLLTRSARALSAAAAAALLGVLMGCSTTQPTLPTVDDTQRRPVNSAAALELLTCRAEAQALRLNMIDPAHAGTRGGACSGVPAPASGAKTDAGPKASSGSSRAVFELEAGKTELVLDDATRQVLRRAAQNADVVLVHAAGSSLAIDVESDQQGNAPAHRQGQAEAHVQAQAQAQAAARALVAVGVEPQKLRVSWSVVDSGQTQGSRAKQTGGTVEVEFVERATRLLFSKPVDQTPPPAVTQPAAPPTDSVKPAVAALHVTGHVHVHPTGGPANKKN